MTKRKSLELTEEQLNPLTPEKSESSKKPKIEVEETSNILKKGGLTKSKTSFHDLHSAEQQIKDHEEKTLSDKLWSLVQFLSDSGSTGDLGSTNSPVDPSPQPEPGFGTELTDNSIIDVPNTDYSVVDNTNSIVNSSTSSTPGPTVNVVSGNTISKTLTTSISMSPSASSRPPEAGKIKFLDYVVAFSIFCCFMMAYKLMQYVVFSFFRFILKFKFTQKLRRFGILNTFFDFLERITNRYFLLRDPFLMKEWVEKIDSIEKEIETEDELV